MINPEDKFNLSRFVDAQYDDFDIAISEMRSGRKESHWMWYIFPQFLGLGMSSMSLDYAIRSKDEALAYLAHPVLGSRLRLCCDTLLQHRGKNIEEIFYDPDHLKLRSSMTLFDSVSEHPSLFGDVLEAFFDSMCDKKTIVLLHESSGI